MAEMNNPQLQGTVQRVEGNAWVRHPDGSLVVLKAGDRINPGDVIVTGHNAHVEIARPIGSPVDIGPDRTVLADQEVLGQSAPDKSEAAILPLDTDADRVIAALNAGQDPFATLEAPAAGLIASGADSGHGFVRLLRIVEDVTPFGISGNNVSNEPEVLRPAVGGSDDSILQRAPEEAPNSLRLGITTSGDSVNEGGTITYTVTVGSPVTGLPLVVTLDSGLEITIPVGATSATSAPVPVRGDDIYAQPNDAITRSITSATGGGFTSYTPGNPVTTLVVDDGDATTVSLAATPSVAEGGSIVYTASLTNPAGTAMTVTLSNGVVINIAAGASSGSASTAAPGDDVYLDAGSVSATIASTAGGNFENLLVNPAAVTTTVSDTTDVTTVSLTGSSSIAEGAAGTYTVSLTSVAQSPVTVTLNYSGTATDGSDYTRVAAVTIPAGASSAVFNIATTDDVLTEGAESFTVGIASASGGNFENVLVSGSSGSVTSTIVDNDATPTIAAVSSPSAVEGSNLVYSVSLSNPSTTPTTHAFAFGTGTANAGADYTAAPSFSDGVTLTGGVLTVPAGVTSFTITVPTVNDGVNEPDETVPIIVGGVTGTGMIVDDDSTPTVTAVSGNAQIEGTSLVHVVTLSNASSVATTHSFALSGVTATAGSDFSTTPTFSNGVTLAGGLITVPAGVTSFTVTVPTVNDTIDEADETTSIVVGGVSATGTINDNDAVPTISGVTNDTQTEGTSLVHTVTLSNASSIATTYSFSLTGVTATAGADFSTTPTFSNGVTLAGGIITVPAGVTSFTVTVPTLNDTIDEPNETTSIVVGGVSATGTINDDDAAPTISAVTSDAQTEGTSLVHTVTLTNASSVATTHSFALSGVTATAGTDFSTTPVFSNGVTLAGGVITVPAGVTSFTVSVPTINDTIDEANETTSIVVGGVSATGTIIDDDAAPTIASVSSPSTTEGSDLVYSVALSNASSVTTTHAFALGGGSASASDFGTPTFSNGVTLAGGVLSVPAGVTSFTVTVPTTQDTLTEGNETVPITVGAATGTGIIVDDDGVPAIASVTSDTQSEGTSLVHTITLSNASVSPTTFSFALSGVTATAGTDFSTAPTFSNGVTLAGGIITVPAGVTSFTVTVPTVNDTIDEPNETTSIVVGGVSATGTIIDNDAVPTVATVSSASATEASNIVHTVTLTNASSVATTYSLALADGSATGGGVDYTSALTNAAFSNGVTISGGVISVPAGVTSFTVTVPTIGDTIDEANETYTLTVGTASGTGTINDDDAAPSISSVSSPSVTEGANLVYNVALSNASSTPTTHAFAFGAGSATSGTDFTAAPTFSNGVTLAGGVLSVPAGVTSFTITVPTINDTINEPNETVAISVGGVTGTGTILDNDAVPTVATVSSASATEASSIVHTVTLTNASSVATTYSLALADGTATGGGVDYTSALTNAAFSNGVTISGGVISVPAGVTSFTVTVPTIGDTIDEANETYTLTVGTASGTGTINDDDAAPTIASVSNASATEASSIVHTVTLTNASSVATTYSLALADGSATGGGVDYTSALTNAAFSNGVTISGGLISVPAGVTSFTVTVPTIGDTIDEPNETYTLTVGTASGTGTINDDDAAPSISSVSSPSANEGSSLVYTVALTNASSSPTTHAFAFGTGTATSGTDFTAAPTFSNGVTLSGGVLSVPAGVTSFTITVPTINDTIDEPNETVPIVVGGVTATGTILDDDSAPTIASVSSPSAIEGSNLTYTVALTNASSVTTTYPFSLGGGSASAGDIGIPVFSNGVTLTGGVLNVPAGVTNFTVTVPTTQDTLAEGNETLPITVGTATGTGTIIDDDGVPTITAVTSDTQTEGTGLVHTVSLSNASTSTSTFSFSLTGVTATAGADFSTTPTFSNGVTLSGGLITVPAGVTSFTVTVPTINDSIDEPVETTSIVVGGVSATGTINDDDATPTISTVTSDAQTEGTALVHTVTLSNASSVATNYSFTLSGVTATAGADFSTTPTFSNGVTLAGGIITVPAGVTSFTVSVPTINDTIDEANETTSIVVGGVSATGTIIDDDAAPTVASVSSASATEASNIIHTVTLSNASSVATTYSLALVDGSAMGGGTDYTSALTNAAFSNGVTISGGVISVPAGVTSFTVAVPTTADTIDEPNETYTFTVGSSAGVGTINDDDAAPTIASVSSPSTTEGTALVYSIALSNASSVTTTYPFTLGGGSASPTDFGTPTFSNGVTLAGGVLSVPAGVTAFTVTVPTTQDTLAEGNETVPITVGTATGTGTIIDDDGVPAIASVTSDTQSEGTSLVHTVTLSNASVSPTTFSFALSGVTATAGTDFSTAPTFSNGVTLAGGIITVPAGVTSFTVTVPTVNDTIDEPNETTSIVVGGVSATGTIIDNDAVPTVATVSSASATEASNIVHTVTLTNASSVATTYSLALADGSATGGGVDYTSALTNAAFSNGVTISGGVISVPAGVVSFTVSVPTAGDTIDEANETYTLTVGSSAGVGTINDDDAAPTIASVSSPSTTEGTALVYSIALSNASSVTTTYPFTLGGGSASPTDFGTPTFSNGVTLAGGVLSVPAGVTAFTVTVPTTQDTLAEGNETVPITVGTATGTGTIIDDDGVPTITSVTGDTQTEGTSLAHTVTLSNTSVSPTTFSFALSGVTATAGADFSTSPTFSNGVTLSGGIITVPAGVASFTVTVPTINDTIDESNETTSIVVGGVSATGTITDDDNAPTVTAVSSNAQIEGTSLVHVVTLSNASSVATTHSFALSGVTATAGSDFSTTPTFSNGVTLAGGIITVPAGVTSFTVTVPTLNDTIDESDETTSIVVGGVSATGTINDNDAVPTISGVTNDTQTEGTSLVHTVTLSNASSIATTYSFSLTGVTATAGADFSTTPTFSNGVTLAGGIITVPAGVTSFTVTVPTLNDTIDEPNETTSIVVGGVSATGTINDDDAAPTISAVTSDAQTEGTSLVHTVTLTNASSVATTHSFALSGVTATAGTDFSTTPVFSNGVTLAGGVITVPAGVTSFTVSVPTINDTIDEANETTSIVVGGVSATGTIIDDDAAPTIASVSSPSTTEGSDLVYSVALSNASSVTTTHAFALGGGSASASDFGTPTFSNGVTLAGGVLSVPAGVTSFTVTVPTTQDTLTEGNETVPITVGAATGTGIIVDDDGVPAIASVTSDTQSEGTSLVHTITLSNASVSPTTFSFALSGVTATAGTDFSTAPTFSNGVTLAGGIITVPAGVTSFTVTVPTVNDTIDEPNETTSIVVGGVSATGTIIDNDAVPTVATVSSASATEASNIVHTVTLTNASSVATTYSLALADGSATGGGVDYTSALTNAAFSNGVTISGGVISVPAGVTSFTVTVPTIGDTIDEANETYTLTVGTASGTGTINDDDAAPSISSVSSPSVTEGANLVYNVALSNASSTPTTHAFAFGAGSATSGTDFTAAPTFSNGVTLAGGVLSVPAGVTSFTITVPTINDTINEPNETVAISVGGVTGTGTILDNDAVPTVATVSSASATEASSIVHTVTLTNASSVATTYSLALADGTATGGGVDYTSALTNAAFSNGVTISGGVISVPAGVTSFTVTVPTIGDTIDEANETYTLTVGTASGTGTINDDDAAPSISSVSSPSVTEGANLVYTVALSNASSTATTHAFAFGTGTATSGTDFSTTPTFSNGVTLAGGVLTVPAGVTSFTITVPTINDTINEPNETVPISVGGVTGTGTILDNDAVPTVATVSSASATEASNIVHTVTLTNASSVATTYSLALADGSATGAGVDYTSALTNAAFSNGVTISGGVISVPAGVTSFTVTVPTIGDTIDEANETYTLTVGTASGTGTINDDDAAPSISSVSSPSVTEGANLVYNVALSNASSTPTTHAFAFGAGSATSGTDFTAAPTFSNGVTLAGGVLSVPAGVTSFTITVPTINDTINEPNETVPISVGGVTGTGTILDNDAVPTVATVSSASATEASSIVHTVTLTNASSVATTYSLALADGTATGGGVDYTSALTNAAFSNGVTISGGVISVPAGVTSFTVTVPTIGDTIDEANETYTLTVGTASGTGTINDDDAAPTIASVSNASATEASSIVHTVTLTNASSVATTYSLALADGSATGGGVDYTSALTNAAFSNGVTISGGLISVPAGVTSFTVTVPTIGDTIDEPNETYTLTVGTASGTGTINDDDAAPSISSVSSPSANEGSSLVYTVALTNASSSPTTHAFAFGTGTATSGTDFTAAPTFSNGVTLSGGVLSVPAGVTSFTISVPTINDTINEPNETVPISVGGVTGTGTILDNDAVPTVATVSSASATEASSIVHTVTLTNASSVATTYSLALADGSATGGGVDYTSALTNAAFSNGVTISGGVISVPAGVTSFTVTVPTIGDTIDEANETYTLTVGTASGTGTINDDDAAPTIASVSNASATEASSIVHTVTLTNASSVATTYSLALADGTATGGGVDYTSALTNAAFSNGVTISGGVISVPAGVTSFTVTVPTIGDTIDEANETYTLTVGTASGTGTINDDDPLPSIASVSSPSITEGANLVYNVALSNASSTPTTHAFAFGAGSATSGTDFTAAPTFSNGVTLAGGVLSVPAGVTSFTITVPTINDTINEPNETVPISVGGVTGTGTILDNDAVPTVATVSSASATEASSIVHTVTLTNASSVATTYSLALADGTATGGGVDYTSALTNAAFSNGVTISGGVISVPAGVTSFTVTVPTIGDTIDEANETYTLTVGTASGTGTINDDDAAPSISSVSSPSVTEGANLVYNVALSNASSTPTTHAFAFGAGSATSGTDFTAAPTFSNGVTLAGGVLSVPAGVTSFTITVPTINDTINEPNETVPISVGGVTGTGTILDNDAVPTVATVSSASATEASSIVHTVTLTNASSVATTYSLALADGSATGGGVDYTSALTNAAFSNGVTISGGVISVPAGVTSFTVTVPTIGDTIDEANETYTLTVGTASGTGTINDDDPLPSIASVSSPSITEGANLVYNVALSNASSTPTTHAFAFGAGSATSGTDFTAAPTFSNGVTLAGGVLSVPAGVTSFTISVPTINDTINEPNETVPISVGGVTGTGTILDNDAVPTVATVSSASATEASSIVHTVTLTNASSVATTYSLALADGSATGGGVDYTSALTNAAFSNGVTISGGVITVPAGVTSFTVSVPTTTDTLDEANETYTLTVGSAAGTGTIVDDDPTPSVSITGPASINEAAVTATYTVTLSAASGQTVTVGYGTTAGTASAGSDYTTTSGTLTFAPGTTTLTFTVPIINDTASESESTESYSVSLSAPSNATLGTSSVTTSIIDNDAVPVLDLDANNSSGATGANYTTSFVEAGAGVTGTGAIAIVDIDRTITDVDSANLTGATVTLTNLQAGDVLAVGTLPAGITAVITGGNVVTLSGSSSLANYQTALSAITFNNTSDTPNTTPRTINVQVTDGTNASNTATTTINVTASNDAPTTNDITATGNEDTLITVTLSGADVDGTVVGYVISTLPANGTLYSNAAGTTVVTTGSVVTGPVYFRPSLDWNGSTSFLYAARDNSNLNDSTPATATINVTAVNDGPPIATNDNFSTVLGTPIVISQAQLLSNDTLRDHAFINGTAAATGGTLTNNGDGTYTFTPTAPGTGSFTYTLRDDDGQTSTATVSITTYATRDDLITVNESALSNGTGGGMRMASGNLLTNDPGATSITSVGGVTDGSANDTDTRAGYVGVNQTVGGILVGNMVVDVAGAGLGDYTYTLLDNANNSAAANNNSITSPIAYVTNTGTANAQITIVDDRPIAYPRSINVAEGTMPSYNLVLVLDNSRSMTLAEAGGQLQDEGSNGTVTASDRLTLAKEAMVALVSAYFDQASSVAVKIITFGPTATTLNGGTAYTDKAALIAAINGIAVATSGGTNYEAGLTAATTAFGTPSGSTQNVSYFISDGNPTSGNTNTAVTNWDSFTASNTIRSYALGVGGGINSSATLNTIHNVDADRSGARDPAIIVPDLNDLAATLTTSVPVAYGGSVVGSSSAVGSALGADDGWVQSITLQLDTNANGAPDTNVTFTYNQGTNQISWTGGYPAGSPITGDTLALNAARGFVYGNLTFNFATGGYTYYSGASASAGTSFAVNFVAQDGDGDVTPSTALTFNVIDGKPIAHQDFDTLTPNGTSFTGNVLTGIGTDDGLTTGTLATDFTALGAGADTIVDGARISSVVFQGQNINLTAASSGTFGGGNYTVTAAGVLTWTHASNGSGLTFNRDGYYNYTPATADLPNPPLAALSTVALTAAPGAATGLTVSGRDELNANATITYNGSGAGVTGSGVTTSKPAASQDGINDNNQVDGLETMVFTFATATHPHGVENLSFSINTNSNLGSNTAAGGSSSLTYEIYHIDGHLLGTFVSVSENVVTLPSIYSNIGRVEVQAASDAEATISDVRFQSVLDDTSTTVVAPVTLNYTLTDTDGDSSSSTLTLNSYNNAIAGDTANNTLNGSAINDQLYGLDGNDTINGGAGNDLLVGGAGNDSLLGGAGDDKLFGSAGNDTLDGGIGNDRLIGGSGNDIMTGGTGSDTFVWSLADRGAAGTPAVDTITAFDNATAAAGGDVLDLRDLLQGETHAGTDSGTLSNYMHFTTAGGNTTVQISSAGGFVGGFNAGAVDQSIVLQGVDLTNSGALATDAAIIQDLLTKGKLQAD